MEKHLVTEPALLTIQIDLRTNLVLKFLIRRISDIIGEVGELVPWFRDNDKEGIIIVRWYESWHLGALTSLMHIRPDGLWGGRDEGKTVQWLINASKEGALSTS